MNRAKWHEKFVRKGDWSAGLRRAKMYLTSRQPRLFKMTEPTNDPRDTLKQFGAWLAALFLMVLGAKLWVAQLYGSPLPLWDQWYEAESFFRPWKEGHLTWQAFFAPYCEHRIFFTRLFDFGTIVVNGRWEPTLQMTANAFICAGYVCGLAFYLWVALGRENGWLVVFLLMPFFVLPYAAENTVWAFNSQAYFLAVFASAALAGLVLGQPGSWQWWLGLAAAVLGLFTMASGVLAPLAAGGLTTLRMLKCRQAGKGNLITLGSCLVVVVLGALLHVTYEGDRLLRAHSWTEFASALARNLAWPFFNAPGMACLIALPLILLAICYFRPSAPESRAAEFLLALGLWSVLQSAALAYGRGNFGEEIPASRYMDKLNVLIIASLFATVLLPQLWSLGRFSKWAGILPLVFAGVIFFGLCRISQIVVDNFLIPTRMMTLEAEERVSTLWTTGGTNAFFQPPTVRPSPEVALGILRNPALQTILPVACLPPGSAPVPGRFDAISWWLLRNSTVVLYCGLGLFVGLLGYGLIRNPLGLALENVPAFAALLTLLAALGFVWSKAPIQREVVERRLQYELADYFKSIGNPERAAIHEKKAEALKEPGKLK